MRPASVAGRSKETFHPTTPHFVSVSVRDYRIARKYLLLGLVAAVHALLILGAAAMPLLIPVAVGLIAVGAVPLFGLSILIVSVGASLEAVQMASEG